MSTEEKIIARLKTLGFPELAGITKLNEFDGAFLNNETLLPNGRSAKILDDDKRYFAIEIEPAGNDKCWGIAADESQIAIFAYGEGGKDCELVAWVKI